jgi:hypothetical protein
MQETFLNWMQKGVPPEEVTSKEELWRSGLMRKQPRNTSKE